MAQQLTKKHDSAALEALYADAAGCDEAVFAEMRSNVLLKSGDHYNRRNSSFFKRIRDAKELTEQQKLRLTKNHIQRITKIYEENILSLAPGIAFTPAQESELQDQKAAELHQAVWQDAKERHDLDSLVDDWCGDFVGCGEVATKIFYDPSAGHIKAYEQEVDAEGMPCCDENGMPARGRPIYSGDLVFETVHGFNLLRAPEAKELRKSPYLIIRKMVDRDVLLAAFGGDPEKEKLIAAGADETYVIFDTAKTGYRRTDSEVLVKEYYFRSCPLYPRGYFYITTKDGILAEGELPGGVFPIAVKPFEKFPTSPRGQSPIKVMRPYQAEINRASSKIAEHQITLGDDKLLIQNGTKVSAGVALPGVRSINYAGMPPSVVPGRTGEQYLAYLQAQIAELYAVMGVPDDTVEAQNGIVDPYSLLFRAASQKKKFSRYVRRFEQFLVEVAKIYIQLAKIHLSDDAFIKSVGRKEAINIQEFRASDDLSYQVAVEAQSDDIETKLGKQLVLNQALQYVGNKLEREDIGKLMRAMPYGNIEESFSDLTIDYDAATNDILALDRGETPLVHEYDNHVYLVKRLVARMRQADFDTLPEEIRRNYLIKIRMHEEANVQQIAELQAAQNEFIPTGGYMVTVDLYVSDPKDPAKTRRARLPYEAVQWLINRLEDQGKTLDDLESMNQGAMAQMAGMMLQQKQAATGAEGMSPAMPVRGAAMP